MIARRRILMAVVAAMALTAMWPVPSRAQPAPKPRPAAAGTAKVTTETRVYLLRGLLNIFSLGMDTLAERLNGMGIPSEVFNHDSWPRVAAQIADEYKAGKKGAVVLIGHSLGADVVFNLAERLDQDNIPVRLLVPFDPTASYAVPKNVDYLLNFYQLNGFGRRVTAGPGFKGELTNMDLSKDESIGHGSIDKSPRLHDLVVAKIQKVALGPAPRKRNPAPKPKPVTAVQSDTTAAGPASPAATGNPATANPEPANPR